ncbi:MAG: hypothetical protein ACHREM_17465 [Polyangiales bacterium]
MLISTRARFALRGSMIFVAMGLASCGPYLEAQLHDRHGFTSPTKCTQGPFEWHVKTLGAKWGERIELRSVGTDGLVGHGQTFVDGKLIGDTQVGSYRYEDYNPASPTPKMRDARESQCALSAAERAAPTTTTTATSGGATTTPSATASGDATTAATAAPARLVEVPVPGGDNSDGTLLMSWGMPVDSWGMKGSLYPAGSDIKILFWTNKLVDLESIQLVVTHSVFVPTCGDEKWAAKLDADKAEAERRGASDKAAAEAKAAEQKVEYDRCYALASKSAVDAKCRDAGWRDVSDSQHCRELAAKDAVDDACRKDGYENASVVAEKQRCLDLSARDAIDDACRAAGFRNHSEQVAAETSPTPMTPPPATKAEEQPPKPSDHADWIPGSWEWSGRDWQWVAGGWKVPDQDRVAKATPKAPSAPPPLQVETPTATPPVAGLVWIAGYWHYSAGRWAWIPGRWARPPHAGATWRPHTWVRDGRGVRLDPGQWILGK